MDSTLDKPANNEQAGPTAEELIDHSDSSSVSTNTDSEIDLSYETQEYIQAIAYEAVSSPNISDVAYMDKLECRDSGCALEMKFFNSQAISRKSSTFLGEINARLESNPSTSHLQFGITTMANGEDGIGRLDLVTMLRRENSFVITVVDDLDAREHQ